MHNIFVCKTPCNTIVPRFKLISELQRGFGSAAQINEALCRQFPHK